jgi:hypothetical protein
LEEAKTEIKESYFWDYPVGIMLDFVDDLVDSLLILLDPRATITSSDASKGKRKGKDKKRRHPVPVPCRPSTHSAAVSLVSAVVLSQRSARHLKNFDATTMMTMMTAMTTAPNNSSHLIGVVPH